MILPLKKEVNDDGEEIKNIPKRVREILKSMCTQMEIIDDEAKIISWRNKHNFTFMNTADFSEDIADIAKYFNGFRQNMQPERRLYIKMGIHTPNDPKRILRGLR